MNPLRILITAGPTIEFIDPVRFISNRSTGQMGYELARLAKKKKYKVTLISGPVSLLPPGGVRHFRVETARQLNKKVRAELKKADILVMASAVCDFRPIYSLNKKIKSRHNIVLKLVKNPDIVGSLAKKEKRNKILVGFALETENLIKNARGKLKKKALDLIIANKLDRTNMPFGGGLKTVYILGRHGFKKSVKKATKKRIARAILDTIDELCYTPN